MPGTDRQDERRCVMTSVTHEPTREAPAKKHFSEFLASQMWASLAISVIWLSVLFEAIYAPAIETRSAGGDYSSVPTAIIGTIFAFLATWVLARHAFRRDTADR
jgi:hypothetical protein